VIAPVVNFLGHRHGNRPIDERQLKAIGAMRQ